MRMPSKKMYLHVHKHINIHRIISLLTANRYGSAGHLNFGLNIPACNQNEYYY